jgi:hypothetical protein
MSAKVSFCVCWLSIREVSEFNWEVTGALKAVARNVKRPSPPPLSQRVSCSNVSYPIWRNVRNAPDTLWARIDLYIHTSMHVYTRMSVRLSARNSLALAELIVMKFDIWNFFHNLSRKFKFDYNLTRITGTSLEDVCTFMIVSPQICLTMRSVSDKVV